MSVSDIWLRSEAFNRFRGEEWMREPCRSCPERTKDFGGCRCQAFLVTGDAQATDPVCRLSPNRGLIDRVIRDAETVPASADQKPLIFRNARNSKSLADS
jgi:pyrroloquinoline quinone biosynthesis protein E